MHYQDTHNRIRIALIAIVFLLASALPGPYSLAQTVGTGAIKGTIADPSGAVVPNVTVTATDPATGYTATQHTSTTGSYVLSQLPPSHYTITVQGTNFETLIQPDVIVDALSVVGLNLTLKVGSASRAVTVSATPPQLNTTNGALDITIPNSTYTALPLSMNGSPKNPTGFVNLLPGTGAGLAGGFNLNGGPSNSSAVYINGMPVYTPRVQGDLQLVTIQNSTEVIDQFQVITAGVPAYYAGQGLTNFVLKSGTNKFHGDVYENFRNTVLDAAGYFATKTPVEHQNEYGGTIGGPILKNRLFFFGNYDGFRYLQGTNPTFYSIPTAAERTGDFSALPVPIYDPDTQATCTAHSTTGTCRYQFGYGPGGANGPEGDPVLIGAPNVIPMNRISSISQSLQSYLPPTINSSLQNNYLGTTAGGNQNQMVVAKVDYTVTPTNHSYLLYEYGNNSSLGQPIICTGAYLPSPYSGCYSTDRSIQLGQIGDTQAITQNLVNVFSYQFNRNDLANISRTTSGNYAAKAGITGLPTGAAEAFPPIIFGGPNSPTGWSTASGSRAHQIESLNTFQDNVQWIHDNHSLTVGALISLQTVNEKVPSIVNSFSMSNDNTAGFNSSGTLLTTTGNAYASFLLGDVNSGFLSDNSYLLETGGRFKQYAAYVQDDWKVIPKLTVNLGLRYQIFTPYIEEHNRESWFNPNLSNPAVDGYSGALQFAGYGTNSCHCRTQIAIDYLAFDPRIGFAYSLGERTVVRGSYSINHFSVGALGGDLLLQGTGIVGYGANPVFTSPDSGITPAFNWNNGFPAYTHPPFFDPTLNTGYNTTTGATGGTLTYNRPDTAGRQAYTQNWNLTIEQQFTPSTVWSLSYAGSNSHYLPVNGGYGIYSDQIDPKYMRLGSILQQPESPTTLAQAQAIFPDIKLPYANFKGSIAQMLRPFPQYSSLSDPNADFGNANYNSLQTFVQHRMSKGLYFLVSYTWSREIDNSSASVYAAAAATPRSAYNLSEERAVGSLDSPHKISLAYVYALPFGRGHMMGGAFTNMLLGGWQISGIQQYSSGMPLAPITGTCLVPGSGHCYANYNPTFTGRVRINGAYGSGQPRGSSPPSYINVNAFTNAPSFTYGNTPRTLAFGLRNPWSLNETLSLGRNFKIFRASTFRFQADAFNLFNRVQFGGISTVITNANFGRVSSQANSARNLQLEASIKF